jgi:hypothetical protein
MGGLIWSVVIGLGGLIWSAVIDFQPLVMLMQSEIIT